MSDDSLGGLGTPTNAPKTRSSRPQGGRIAGSSSTKPGTRRQKPVETPAEIIDLDQDEDEDELASTQPPVATHRKQSTRGAGANKQKSAKSRGKAKMITQRSTADETADEAELVESDIDSIGTGLVNRSKKVADSVEEVTSLRRRCDKLEIRLQRETQSRVEADKRCEDLTKQLERSLQLRETEPEALMREQKEQFEAQIAAYERLNTELTSALAKVQPLATSGSKASVLHLLTREAADEEKRQIEQEVSRWKRIAEESKEIVKEKEQKEKELLFELDIERKKSLKGDKQSSVQRPRGELLGPDHPRNVQLIRFYEDNTNLLVMGLRAQPGRYLSLDDWILTCVFTYVGENTPPTTQSLNFTLTARWEKREPDDPKPVTSRNDLIEMMYYEPLELEKESEEFIRSLNYMGSNFSFSRDQLALFLRTLHTTIGEALNPTQDNSGGEEDELIE